MAANGTGALALIDNVTADKSSRMISNIIWVIVSAYIQPQNAVSSTPFTCLGLNLNESLKLKHILCVSFQIYWAALRTNNIRIVSMPQYLWT